MAGGVHRTERRIGRPDVGNYLPRIRRDSRLPHAVFYGDDLRARQQEQAGATAVAGFIGASRRGPETRHPRPFGADRGGSQRTTNRPDGQHRWPIVYRPSMPRWFRTCLETSPSVRSALPRDRMGAAREYTCCDGRKTSQRAQHGRRYRIRALPRPDRRSVGEPRRSGRGPSHRRRSGWTVPSVHPDFCPPRHTNRRRQARGRGHSRAGKACGKVPRIRRRSQGIPGRHRRTVALARKSRRCEDPFTRGPVPTERPIDAAIGNEQSRLQRSHPGAES